MPRGTKKGVQEKPKVESTELELNDNLRIVINTIESKGKRSERQFNYAVLRLHPQEATTFDSALYPNPFDEAHTQPRTCHRGIPCTTIVAATLAPPTQLATAALRSIQAHAESYCELSEDQHLKEGEGERVELCGEADWDSSLAYGQQQRFSSIIPLV